MNKSELIGVMAAAAGITKTQAGEALEAFQRAVMDTLSKGDKVALSGFGTFSATQKAARTGRNPKTGEEINIPAKKAPKFSAGTEFKKTVNK